MSESKAHDIAVGTALVVLALLGVFVVIPAGIVMPGDIDIRALAPNFWPLIIMVSLALAGAVLIVQGLMKGRLGLGARQEPEAFGDSEELADVGENLPLGAQLAKVGAAVMVLFVYYAVIQLIGIVAASVAAVVVFMLLGGERRLKIVVPIALILPSVLYYFFTYIAKVPMPLGLFETWL